NAAARPVMPPPMITTTKVTKQDTASRVATAHLMNVGRKRLDLFEGRVGQNSMAEVEDVTRPSCGPSQHVVCRAEETIAGAEKKRGIEISLDSFVEPD